MLLKDMQGPLCGQCYSTLPVCTPGLSLQMMELVKLLSTASVLLVFKIHGFAF